MEQLRLAKNIVFTKDTPFLPRVVAVASLVLLGLLVLVPCAVLFLAVSPESASQHRFLFHFPVVCWAVWAMVSLWAALDSPKVLRTLGWPGRPSGVICLLGHAARRAEYWSFVACHVANIPVKERHS